MSAIRILPAHSAIDYGSILLAAQTEGIAKIVLSLQEALPSLWREAYQSTVTHQTNLVHLRFGTFEYICDVYSDLEAKGEVAYDQTVRDRVVAAFGCSGTAEQQNGRRSLRWIDRDEQLAITERDHGHPYKLTKATGVVRHIRNGRPRRVHSRGPSTTQWMRQPMDLTPGMLIWRSLMQTELNKFFRLGSTWSGADE